MPLTIGFFLVGIGIWFLSKGYSKKAKYILFTALLWFALISSAPVANLLLAPLEKQYPQLLTIPPDVNYLLLLGGDRQRRAWEVLRLYQLRPDIKIITSGYSMYDPISEAKKVANMLQSAGVDKNSILMQEDVFDTKGEAVAIKKRLGKAPFLLVTSAYHMPRAMKIFQKIGTSPVAAPADFNNPDEDGINTIFRAEQVIKTQHAMHEYLGLLWLYLVQ